MLKILQLWTGRQMFSANWSQTKSSGIILPEVHSIKKILDSNSLSEKQKIASQIKKGSEIKPGLGQGWRGIKTHKKNQTTKYIKELAEKLQEILKTPATQNIAKNRMGFPMHEQSISNSKTEAIT